MIMWDYFHFGIYDFTWKHPRGLETPLILYVSNAGERKSTRKITHNEFNAVQPGESARNGKVADVLLLKKACAKILEQL